MKIKWLGHSCFVITSDKGAKVMTDPYKKDTLGYSRPAEKVDAVTVSHDHYDHYDPGFIASLPGKPQVIKNSKGGKAGDISIKGLDVWHDENKGKQRGPNVIFSFDVDGVNVCHLGDLGHQLSSSEINALGKVDVLLIPIGGVFTIDYKGAGTLCEAIKPRIVMPMHFKTAACSWLEFTAEDFIKDKKSVSKTGKTEIELDAERLPSEMQVVVLDYVA